MGISSLTLDSSGPIVDLSSKGLQKLEQEVPCDEDTHTLILDQNHIIKLEHLEKSCKLQQLSVASNRLVRMMGVSRLTNLRVLNLPDNSIGYIEGLKDLAHLEWLNLAGNNIKVMEQLSSCVALRHLDLSDNNVSQIGDLSKLSALKTLLLHGNIITTLRTVPAHLHPGLTVLSLAENEIRDLNEVSYLASLPNLEQLSVMSNPCVMATSSLPGYDYRPYIMSWCLSLKILDGYMVSQKEGLKAEWLYSQGKGRLYRPGQHVQLVQYLASVCPLTSASALQSAEDAKLEKILSKQRLHQRQLFQQTQRRSASPARPTQLDIEPHQPSHGPAGWLWDKPDTPDVSMPTSHKELAVQVNNWLPCDHSYSAAPPNNGPSSRRETLYLEDMTEDDDKLGPNSAGPYLYSPTPSEEELDEPDSLAPPTERKVSTPVSPCSFPVLGGQLAPEAHSDCAELQQEKELGRCDPGVAAVKIQAWWRGIWTRRFHPLAKEVRSEIRLRRMQEHIIYLSGELENVRRQQEEERLQRLVQEEAVKFLWKQLQSAQQWQRSLEEKLQLFAPASPPPDPTRASPVAPPCGELSFPDSGFQSSGQPCGPPGDGLSGWTGEVLETVRVLELNPREENQDASLLQQYLSSVQQLEEAEEVASDGTRSPLPLSSPPTHNEADPSPRMDMTG